MIENIENNFPFSIFKIELRTEKSSKFGGLFCLLVLLLKRNAKRAARERYCQDLVFPLEHTHTEEDTRGGRLSTNRKDLEKDSQRTTKTVKERQVEKDRETRHRRSQGIKS